MKHFKKGDKDEEDTPTEVICNQGDIKNVFSAGGGEPRMEGFLLGLKKNDTGIKSHQTLHVKPHTYNKCQGLNTYIEVDWKSIPKITMV